MKSISVIHPSRGRPSMAYDAYKKVISQASGPVQYILSLDTTDPYLPKYQDVFAGSTAEIVISDNLFAISAINTGAKEATGDILLVMSDDFQLANDWDNTIRMATEGRECWLLKTFDGAQKWIATLPIMDSVLYERLGYIYYPGYRHMFADTDLSSICDMMAVTIYRTDITFRHNHFTVGFMKKDAVNDRNNSTWTQGEKLYRERHLSNYGLKPEEIKGTIIHQEHIEWLKTK